MPKIINRSFPETDFSDVVPALLRRIYAGRGVSCDDQVCYSLQSLLPPNSLQGLSKALDLLVDAFYDGKRLLIVGDFDADGATSCALSVLAFRALGLKNVDFLVPNRFEYGYGLTPEIVHKAQDYHPDIILTVDNGIASVEGVAEAKDLGLQVIITDHHLSPMKLPIADAIVNPNQSSCCFPSKHLAGVGVIFYVLCALRTRLRSEGWFSKSAVPEPNLTEFLDLVALGTVADVVPMDHNNRILVYQGLQRIRAGRCRPGILSLLAVAGKNFQNITSQDLGFILGPRLNAAGRLDDISIGIQCLLTDDHTEALELATQLDDLNRDRRSIETVMQREATELLASMSAQSTDMPWGLCLFNDQWHQGVVGILASRIKDKFHRPVIAFARAEDNTLKGSARSIPGLHIRDALDSVATMYPGVLTKFGGHAMAAGLTLEQGQYDTFSQGFDRVVRERLCPQQLEQIWEVDGELGSRDLKLETAQLLQTAGPWGQNFPEPLFRGRFLLVNQRIVGVKHLKLSLAHLDSPQTLIDAIAFNIDVTIWPNPEIDEVKIVYQLSINEFRGMQSLQLLVKYIE
ncbi:MAG: single-stranded-DNA-specific exonuclease [Cellvibrionaceae bacterium]|jgi:single-stranded-DNA-specific exonuclease